MQEITVVGEENDEIKRKMTMKSENNLNTVIKSENNLKASRNITLMVIFQCVLYTFGMCPYLIGYILSYVLESTAELKMYNNISYGILFFSHGSTLFIYLAFNKLFRQVLVSFFCRKI